MQMPCVEHVVTLKGLRACRQAALADTELALAEARTAASAAAEVAAAAAAAAEKALREQLARAERAEARVAEAEAAQAAWVDALAQRDGASVREVCKPCTCVSRWPAILSKLMGLGPHAERA